MSAFLYRQRLVVNLTLVLLSSYCLVLAQNTWIYPKPNTNPTFSNDDILEASWTSDFSNPTLLLLCDFPGPPSLNASVQPTGSFPVPLDYGSGVYACHLNLAEDVAHGGSLNSPNFNLVPPMDSSPMTWNSKSGSGPTTTTVSTSVSAPALLLTSVARTTVTTGVPVSSSVVARYATSTRVSSSSPSSTSSPSQRDQPSIGAIVGASIAGVVGVASLVAAIILCFRRRSRGRKEILPSPQGIRADQYVNNRTLPELGVLAAVVEADGQQHHGHELRGYPRAVGHCMPVRELEGG